MNLKEAEDRIRNLEAQLLELKSTVVNLSVGQVTYADSSRVSTYSTSSISSSYSHQSKVSLVSTSSLYSNYANSSFSSSYALTASYALNGGGSGSSPSESSSYAQTASLAYTASFFSGTVSSASFAISSSHATNATSLISLLDEKEGIHHNYKAIENTLGSNVLVYNAHGPRTIQYSVAINMVNTRSFFLATWIPYNMVITGVEFYQNIQGNFTGNNENAIALYTYSSGSITKVASTANDQNIWKGTGQTIQRVAFTSSYSASRGLHYIGWIYCNSAQTTAPAILATATYGGTNQQSAQYTSSAKISSYKFGATSLGVSESMSSLTNETRGYYFALY